LSRIGVIFNSFVILCICFVSAKKWQNEAPLKQEESFKVRFLIGETKERVKLHLHNTKETEIDIEKEWKNLQKILKSAANESLGTIKRNTGKSI
jgi:hypothetical protein